MGLYEFHLGNTAIVIKHKTKLIKYDSQINICAALYSFTKYTKNKNNTFIDKFYTNAMWTE